MMLSGKAVCIMLAITLLLISSLAAKTQHPYSYLAKPPINLSISVTPDKAMYNRNEIITFKVIAELDTLKALKSEQYRLVIGNLGELLVSSQLMKSDVQSSYDIKFEKNIVKMKFTVQMLQDDTPPFIKVEAVKIADATSLTKKQYRNMVIDKYAIFYITSPEFRATKQ